MQNEFENSKYWVLTDKPIKERNRHYIYIEDCKTNDIRKLQICPYAGTRRVLIRQNIMKHLPNCDTWVVARVIGDVLYLGFNW